MQNNNMDDVEQKLIALTKQLLAESGEQYLQNISLDASLHRHLGIDSLTRAELFQRIEKKFSISCPDRLLAEADTLAEIANYVRQAAPASKEKVNHHLQQIQHEQSSVNVKSAKTLVEVLAAHAQQTPNRVHIYFHNEEGEQETLTYGQLFAKASSIARALHKRGMKPGETIAIMQPTQLGFFYSFFGTLLAGCIPVPIYPPFRPHMLEHYAKQEARILHNAEVRMLITFQQAEKLSRLLRAFVPSLKEVITVDDLLAEKNKPLIHAAQGHDGALIQYTSGSTSAPKGVLLSHNNLLANIRAYGQSIHMSPDDVGVTWLPLYHDFGLIGSWLGSLYSAMPLVLMTPFSFLNRPERWLWMIHQYRATLSGGPNFAYELCAKKIEPSMIEGLDLSSWRMAANGAEAIYPKTLERFAEKFAPYGFKREAILPAYGLAESTVCLAIPPINTAPRIDYVDRTTFESEKKAKPVTDTTQKNCLAFVSCGKPLPGHELRIVDENDNVLPERVAGSLQFRGPSTMQGYYNNPAATAAITHDGWLDSGDIAYVAEGDLFISGRKKDLIIKAGRNLYPAEIEELVGNIPGIRQGCVVAFGTGDPQRGTEKLVVVAETREKNHKQLAKLSAIIHEAIANNLDIVPDQVLLVAPHIVPKTSSGKLQRSACKNAYLEGRLAKQPPAWLQIGKLSTKWTGIKIRNGVLNLLKGFYTAYVCLLIIITVPPIWLSLHFISRRAAAKLCKSWAHFICIAAFCPITIIGEENLKQSAAIIYVANHSTYVDPVFLMGILPSDVLFVAKKEIFSQPIFRDFTRYLNYLPVDRLNLANNLQDTQRIEETLQQGNSIVIYPEGTFTYAIGLRPFKSGAFKTAAETNTAICPIAVKGARNILRAEKYLMRPSKVTITIGKPIQPQGSAWRDIHELKSQVRAFIAEHCGEPSLDFITPIIPGGQLNE